MKVLFAASEAVPYVKTGGLADVATALSRALADHGHSVVLILPLYRSIRDQFPDIQSTHLNVFVPLGSRHEKVQIWEDKNSGPVRVLFAKADAFFDRPGVYGERPGTAYDDNDQRFALFSRAVFEIARVIQFKPQIIHGHDWQTGLISAHLRYSYKFDKFFKDAASIFTIHNMAYQGNFPPTSFALTHLPMSAYQMKGLEFYNQVSYLKAGLVYSHALNTVSPTYAREVMTDGQFGAGMEGIMRQRVTRFRGIINGLDNNIWNPKTDPHVKVKFSLKTLDQRRLCKADLQKSAKLPVKKGAPLLSFVGRLDYQKGIDHLISIMPGLLSKGAQFVALGQGQEEYVKLLLKLRRRFPKQVSIELKFAEELAHKIYAGTDLFLMPSRYEPCGLGQLIAMRYGAIPVVTPTGGLIDTVHPIGHKKANGFIGQDPSTPAYLKAVQQAISILKSDAKKKKLQRNGMTADWSWSASVSEYENLYADALVWAKEGRK